LRVKLRVVFNESEDGRTMELNVEEIELLLDCLKSSIRQVSEAHGTPYAVRQENLQRLYAIQEKLRKMRAEH
jgi:hypothetical protein